MKKKSNTLNYKLINAVLIIVIVCLLYLIKDLWLGIAGKIFQIIFPFFLAFAIAYALHPFDLKLRKAGVPKWLSIFLICFISIGLVVICLILIIPLFYEQTLLFISNISVFLTDIAAKFELNLGVVQTSLSDISSSIISSIGTYVSDGAINIVNSSVSLVASIIIVAFVSVYLLIDMDKIREYIKTHLYNDNRRMYNYVRLLDNETKNYFNGLGKNIIWQFFEYTIVFFLIGHPNYLVLGFLAAITTIIPYFGGFIINVIAILIASVISTKLLILTIIVILICPQIDGYVVGPRIYGKTNKIHPLINIFAVFAGGILAGFWGIVASLPVAIIVIATYKFFKNDIDKKVEQIKGKEKKL